MQANANSKAQILHLEEILEQITNIEDVAIADTVAIAQQTEDFVASVDAIDLPQNELLLNPRCSKTGQPLQPISIQAFKQLHEICGKERAISVLQKRLIGAVAPHWVYTDDTALTQLAKYDPRGYCVYAINSIVKFPTVLHMRAQRKSEEEIALATITAKAAFWDYLQTEPLDLIIKINEMARRYLSVVQTQMAYHIVKFERQTLAEVTNNLAAFHDEIKNNLIAVIRYEYKAGRIRSNLTYDDVVNLRLRFGGHSNFRAQNKLKKMSDTEFVLEQLKEFLPNETAAQISIRHRPRDEFANEQQKVGYVKASMETTKITLNVAQQPQQAPEQKQKPALKLTFAQLLASSKKGK
jgi:hypothetical protein